MKKWIDIHEESPKEFPCYGININHKFHGNILGKDNNCKIGDNWFYCEGLPSGMSMPITHWAPLDQKPELPE